MRKNSLILAALMGLVLTFIIDTSILAAMVSRWKLDETVGSANAIDSSGNGHTGTLRIAAGLSWEPSGGFIGGCIYFNNTNTNSGITVPSTGMTATAGTIMLWGKLSDPQPARLRYFIKVQGGNSSTCISFSMDSGDNKLDATLGSKISDIFTFGTDTWYHLAIIYSGSGTKTYTVYVNGSAVYTGSGNFSYSTVTIGNGSSSTNSDSQKAFAGRIDDVRFYDTALSGAEVYNIFSGAAFDPNPASGATEVSLSPTLSWSEGEGTLSHNVYFGSINPPAFAANVTVASFSPGAINHSTIYYWRVDEVKAAGAAVGPVWSFTTIFPPVVPSGGNPANGSTGVLINQDLSWQTSAATQSYNVYFGTSTPVFIGNTTATTFDQGVMAVNKTYYWRIEGVNAAGSTTGPLWSFTTETGKALSPNPSNGASALDVFTQLSWTAGAAATSHSVYFGESNPPPFMKTQVSTAYTIETAGVLYDWTDLKAITDNWLCSGGCGTGDYDGDGNVDLADFAVLAQDWLRQSVGLKANTTYYWRVDEQNSSGTVTGDLWSFTTKTDKAVDPSPGMGEADVSKTRSLSWTAGFGATAHKVYLGLSNPPAYQGTVTAASFTPAVLASGETYYWRIDEVSSAGTVTGVLWNFMTKAEYNDPNHIGWWRFDESSGKIAYDSSEYENDGLFDQGPAFYPAQSCVEFEQGANHGNCRIGTKGMSLQQGAVCLWMTAAQETDNEVDSAFITRMAFGFRGANPRLDTSRIQIYMDGWSETNPSDPNGLIWHPDYQLDIGMGDNHTLMTNVKTLTLDTWYHVALVWNNGTATVYVNGNDTIQSASCGAMDYEWISADIGNNGGEHHTAHTGLIDDVHMYNKALTAAEVLAIYNAGRPGIYYGPAKRPVPANRAISVDAVTTISWIKGEGAMSHDVYFGTVNPPPFVLNTTSTSYSPAVLTAGTTYYWRIDEHNPAGVTTGEAWRFNTISAAPAGKATGPKPKDSQTGVKLTPTFMRWTKSYDSTSFDVYFGTVNPPPFKCNQAELYYCDGVLEYNTTYYWRIDMVNSLGRVTGDIWSFKTQPMQPGHIVGWFKAGGDGSGQVSNIPAGSNYIVVSAGDEYCLAIKTDGSLISWGRYTSVPAGTDYVAISAGRPQAYALKKNGTLAAWNTATVVPGDGFVGLSRGGTHHILVKKDGSLYPVGGNSQGQTSETPKDKGYIQADTGNYCSNALRYDGTVVCWGYNGHGEGYPPPEVRSGGIIDLQAGGYHGLALKDDDGDGVGMLYGWGLENGWAPPGTDYIAISDGGYARMAMHADGSLYSWHHGETENGPNTPTDSGYVFMSAGDYVWLAIKP